MVGKKLLKGIFGRSSADCKKEDKNEQCRQSTPMVQRPVKHEPLQTVSNTFSLQSAAARPEDTSHELQVIRYEKNSSFQNGVDEEDINMAATVFIDTFHRDLRMQRTVSEARCHDYLERAR